MIKGKGPVLPEPLEYEKDKDLKRFKDDDVNKSLGYVFKAITLTRHKIEGKVPLIGFAGAPWTIFAYMVEGGGSKTWKKAIKWLYKYPELSHKVFDRITTKTIDYLVGQVKAGAQALEVFDSWAGILAPELFKDFCLKYNT
eukprot:UN29578